MASALTALALAGPLGISTALAGAVWAGRHATSPTYMRRYDIVPLAVSDESIELRATRHTLAPGEFGLHLSTGGPPAVIGSIISTGDGKVTRHLLHRPAELSLESKGRWSGIVAAEPSTGGAEVTEVLVSTPLGPAPAWMIDRGSSHWIIHVHGQGSDRRQTLRGVESSTALGLNSLVISYRNDGEGPRSRDDRSHLGESEWLDLESALRFVAERGGTECIVFGWSMGATIALNTAQRSAWGTMIKGIVMVSPVLAWQDVMRANARHQGLPNWFGSIIARGLSTRTLSRLVGLECPLDVLKADRDRLEGSLGVPVLIIHNTRDWSVPIAGSHRFAQAHKNLVELVLFHCVGHTQEWNSDRIRWDMAVRRWYEKLFQPGTAEEYAGG